MTLFNINKKNNLNIFKKLIQLQVHVGHLYFNWNPLMNFYLLGRNVNYHILDVRLTTILLRKALMFVQYIYQHNGFSMIISNTTEDELLHFFLRRCSHKFGISTYTINWSPAF